jgi:hypothetical protein
MSNKVSLLDVAAAESIEQPLEIVRLGSDETAIIPFTADSEEVDLHYCAETEISSYVLCNGDDCVLCHIGRKRETRLLLPVYLPVAGCIGILPVSKTLRPYSLLPQLSNILNADKPIVMFITREGGKYTISTVELQENIDGGEVEIKKFIEQHDGDNFNLSLVYSKIDNEQLSRIDEIARMMKYKGLRRE